MAKNDCGCQIASSLPLHLRDAATDASAFVLPCSLHLAAGDLLKAAEHFSACDMAGTDVEHRCAGCMAGQAAIRKARA